MMKVPSFMLNLVNIIVQKLSIKLPGITGYVKNGDGDSYLRINTSEINNNVVLKYKKWRHKVKYLIEGKKMMVYIILHIVISILKLNLNLLIIRITTFRKIFLITNVNQFIMMKINTILKCFLEKYMYNVLEENKQFLFQYKY